MVNVLNGVRATEEQACDILNCHEIRTDAILNTITNAPLRRHRLLTMTSLKRKRASSQEKETKQVLQCLRRKLAWYKHNTQPDAFDNDQFSLLPRAIVDEEGYPHKGTKSHWTDKLHNRYKAAKPTVFMNFPLWTPQVVLIDAMFLINIRPLRRTKTISDHTSLLFNQVVVPYYKSGTHLIFDKPGRQVFNPKLFDNIIKSTSIRQHNKED